MPNDAPNLFAETDINEMDRPVPVYDSRSKKNILVEELIELNSRKYLVGQLIKRNLQTRYRKSILGVFWSVLEPLATMVIMVAVFTYLLKSPIPDFPVFLLSGLAIWNFFYAASNMAIVELSTGNQLSKHVYIPKSVFVISGVISNFVNFLITLAILLVFLVIFHIPVYWHSFFTILVSIFLTVLFTSGVGFLVAALNIFYADVMRVYQIFLHLLLYLSAVFYDPNYFRGVIAWIIKLNPIYQLINLFRHGILFGQMPSVFEWCYSVFWSIGIFVFGFYVFTRLRDRFIYYA